MVLLREINMHRNRYVMLSLLPAVSVIKKVNLIVDRAVRIVNRLFPHNENIPLDTMAFHTLYVLMINLADRD